MNLFKKIKEFFDQPDQMDLIENRFLERLEDMKKHPEKYRHILNKSGGSNVPSVSLF